MNCTECNTPIPDGKLFCPQCGYLNEPSRVHSKLLQPTTKLSKQNIFVILGGVIVIISCFFPWPGFFYGYQTGLKSFPQELIRWLSAIYVLIAGSGQSGASPGFYLAGFYYVSGCLAPVAGGLTAYFAYKNNAKMRGASIVTGVIALFLLTWYGAKLFTGKFVLLAGLICLIISLLMKDSNELAKRGGMGK